MSRPLVLGPTLAFFDIAVTWLLLHGGASLQSSQLSGFALAAALYLVTLASSQSRLPSAGGWAAPLLTISIASALLRSAVLGLLVGRAQWPPQWAILLAAPAGLTMLLWCGSLATSVREPAARWRDFVVALTIYSTVLRLLYAGSLDLMPEETYYWNYAQHLDYGYLDHPPMVAWLIRASTAMFGQNEFAVRAGANLCGALTTLFVYRLTRNVFGAEAALASLALTQALPFFFSSGLLMTPDSPLTASWAACLYFLERALVAEKASAWWRAGIALGLGLISKYTILLLALAAFAFVAWNPRSRHWLRRSEPYLAVSIALLIFTPVIIWNFEHHWASFAFQTSGRLAEHPRFALPNLLGSVILLLSPIGVLALLLDLGRKDPQRGAGHRWLTLATLLPLAVFFLFSLRHQVKLDWTGAPWVAAMPVVSCGMITSACLVGLRARIRAAWPPMLAAMILIYAAGLDHLALGWPGIGYASHIEILPVGWRDLTCQITAVVERARQADELAVVVGMDRYAIASEIAFESERMRAPLQTSSAHLFQGVGLMYELWTPPVSLASKTLLLVAFDPNDLKGRFVEPHAARFGPIETISLARDGKPIRDMYYRFAYDYRP